MIQNTLKRLWYNITHMDIPTPAGFESVLGKPSEVTETTKFQQDIIPSLPPDTAPPLVHNTLSASALVQSFLKEHRIRTKTVVLGPSQAWIGDVFVQTDKDMLGITYEFEEQS